MEYRIPREDLFNALVEAVQKCNPGDVILLPDTLSESFKNNVVTSAKEKVETKAVQIDFYRAPRKYTLPRLSYLAYLKETVLPDLTSDDTIIVTAPNLTPKQMQEILTRFAPGVFPKVTYRYEEVAIG